MKAWVCTELNGEDGLVLQDLPSPPCGPKQIRVAVSHAALNFPDALITRGLYQVKREPPFVLGTEMAGTIIEAGAEVTGFRVGQRIAGVCGFGGFGEEVVFGPPAPVVALPDSMPFDIAAGLSITYGTSMHALAQRGQLKAGETLLVLGAAGGCGSAAVEIGKAMGARVIAGASSDEKCAVTKQLGADESINYSTENLRDRVLELTGGQGADVIFDPVGDKLFEPARRSIAFGGRYLVVGFAGGEIPTLSVNHTLLKSMSVCGVVWGVWAMRDPRTNAANFEQLFAWFEQGRIKPYIGSLRPFTELADACRELHAGKAIGKTVIQIKSL